MRITKYLAAMAAALITFGGSALAQQPVEASVQAHLAGVSVAELEEAFWVCDYSGTTRGAAADKIAICTAVYDTLKARKFGGDFDGLLAWWQRNKPAQFERLAALDTPRR